MSYLSIPNAQVTDMNHHTLAVQCLTVTTPPGGGCGVFVVVVECLFCVLTVGVICVSNCGCPMTASPGSTGESLIEASQSGIPFLLSLADFPPLN